MNIEQLTLSKRFCELVGWLSDDKGFPYFARHDGSVNRFEWLFTGDGMLAVKAEMAKRMVVIVSATAKRNETELCAWAQRAELLFNYGPHAADTEPEAVLKAAVAAMKGCAE